MNEVPVVVKKKEVKLANVEAKEVEVKKLAQVESKKKGEEKESTVTASTEGQDSNFFKVQTVVRNRRGKKKKKKKKKSNIEGEETQFATTITSMGPYMFGLC